MMPHYMQGERTARHAARVMVSAVLALALGACAMGPTAREAPSVYDLGPPGKTEKAVRIAARLLLPPMDDVPAQDETGIVFRLAYRDAAQPRIYANSRWAEAPAAMLTRRARSHFALASEGVLTSAAGAGAPYAVRMELEEFSQVFSATEASRAVVRVRASILDLGSRTLTAQRTFEVERPAAPNAAGAAQALAIASDQLIEDMIAWTAQTLAKSR